MMDFDKSDPGVGISRGNQLSDWNTNEDYDPGDADWHDTTVVGSNYQIEIDVSTMGHFRHRMISPPGPWAKGLSPDLSS